MKKLILASHGSLAKGMKSAVAMIAGDTQDIEEYSLDEWKDPQVIRHELQQQINRGNGDEYILVTDIQGGSVFNELTRLCMDPRVVLLPVMSLPLVLQLKMTLSQPLSARQAAETALSLALRTEEKLDAEKLKQLLCEGKEEWI